MMRKDYFLAGIGFRFVMITFFIIGNYFESYNDMSEIIFQGLVNMLQGQNPYSTIYTLEWGSGSFSQPLNYGPVTLLLYLPAMLFPWWYNRFWVGMTVMNTVYTYLLAEYMMRKLSFDPGLQKAAKSSQKEYEFKTRKSKSNPELIGLELRRNRFIYYSGVIIWCIPWGTLFITNFLMMPIYLTTLAFGNRENPIKCSFYICLSAMAYQLCYLFIPIYALYHFKKNITNLYKFALGAIPSLLLFAIFMIWSPGGIFYSLFGYTSEMGYVKCPDCDHTFENTAVFSIPKMVYLWTDGKWEIGNYVRIILVLVLGLILLNYLIKDKFDNNPEKYIQIYHIYVVIGFILTNNYGQLHYGLLLIVPCLILHQILNPNYRKSIPIGVGIQSWEHFEKYLMKYNHLPE